jgi:tetratricopeptide (TPR) repeat protein
VAHICHLVEGMPLALLLAVSWTRMLRPGQIAALLAGELDGNAYGAGQGLDLLETDWRDVPARQRSMRAVFDHSWRLLTERQQEVLAALAVFRGGFTPQVAREVTGASLRELLSLVDRSLLQRTAPGRYDAHELLRQYAEEKLDERPAAAQRARDRHSRTFCAALGRWAADLKCARQQEALAEMDAEVANVLSAWDWAAARGPVERIRRAMEGLRLYYSWRRLGKGTRSLYVAVVERFRHALPPPDREDHALAKRTLALALMWHAPALDAERTRQLFQESLALLDDASRAGHDARAERALVLLNMGDRTFPVDLKETRPLYERSVALCWSLGNDWDLAKAQTSLGACLSDLGHYGQAEQLYQDALATYRALGDRGGVAHALQGMGLCALLQGRPEGERQVREAMAIYQDMDDQTYDRRTNALWGLSQTLLSLGRYAEARTLLEESTTESDSAGKRCLSNILLGLALVNLGRYKGARTCGQMGLDLAREANARGNAGLALFVLGYVALAEGAYAEAARLLQQSVAAHRRVGQSDMLGWALACLACAAWHQGDLKGALQLALVRGRDWAPHRRCRRYAAAGRRRRRPGARPRARPRGDGARAAGRARPPYLLSMTATGSSLDSVQAIVPALAATMATGMGSVSSQGQGLYKLTLIPRGT